MYFYPVCCFLAARGAAVYFAMANTRYRTEEDKEAYRHYDMTVAMLNKTMGLCLR